MKIIRYKKLASTQEKAKKLKRAEDFTVVVADRQTSGKGTKGRSFSSSLGGLYLSVIRLYPCEAKEAFSIMVSSAVAVIKTLKAFGVSAKIKWPNDIYLCGKKLCGILIENTVSGEEISKSVVGIGINVNSEIPKDLKEIAISLKEILNAELDLKSVLATLLYNLTLDFGIDEYKKHSFVLGKEITVIKGEEVYKAVAKDVSEKGELILESGEILSSAEVSIRCGNSPS